MSFWPQTIPWKLCDILGLVWSTYKNRWTLFENDLIHLHRYWIINFDLGLNLRTISACRSVHMQTECIETFWLHEWFLIWVMNNEYYQSYLYHISQIEKYEFLEMRKNYFVSKFKRKWIHVRLFNISLWEFSLILNFMHIRIVRKLANF